MVSVWEPQSSICHPYRQQPSRRRDELAALDGDRAGHPFGTGPAARRAAFREADRLWQEGIAARAGFDPKYGGWAVLIFAGGVRQRRQD